MQKSKYATLELRGVSTLEDSGEVLAVVEDAVENGYTKVIIASLSTDTRRTITRAVPNTGDNDFNKAQLLLDLTVIEQFNSTSS